MYFHEKLPLTEIGLTGLLSLFLPSINLFGVNKSIFLLSLTILPKASGRSFTAFVTSDDTVSH